MVDVSPEYVKKLERRIHKQRVALRDNWQIIEQRANYKNRWPLMHYHLRMALDYAAENRMLKAQLAGRVDGDVGP